MKQLPIMAQVAQGRLSGFALGPLVHSAEQCRTSGTQGAADRCGVCDTLTRPGLAGAPASP